MSSGWIKLHREMLEWEWYDDINTKCLFIHCLLRANYSDNNWRGIQIKRGSFLTSLETLSKETKLSVSQIRTSIRKLEMTGEIASSQQARSRVITVLKYDEYQGNDKVNSSEIAGCSQDDDKLMTTNKNNNKDKNEENEKKTIGASACRHGDVIDIYHETLPELPKVIKSRWKGSKSEKNLTTRWRENKQHEDDAFWKWFFSTVRTNPHWMGDNDRGWTADLHWLLNRTNFDKVITRGQNNR